MRQFNFIVIFAICLAVSFFAMQNASFVTVNVAPGMSFEAPLVVELLLAGGLGAGLAWLFSAWSRAQFVFEFRQQASEIEDKDNRIAELKDLVVELESTVAQLPPSKRAEPDGATIEAKSEEEIAREAEANAAERMMG